MVQAHLGSAVIIEHIRTHPGKYSLTSDDLSKLKREAVPDEVISAMQQKSSSESGAASSTTSSQPAVLHPADTGNGSCHDQDHWQFANSSSTTGLHIKASLCRHLEPPAEPGVLRVTGSCDANQLTYQFVFISDASPQIPFVHNSVRSGTRGANFTIPIKLLYGTRSGQIANQRTLYQYENFDNTAELHFLGEFSPGKDEETIIDLLEVPSLWAELTFASARQYKISLKDEPFLTFLSRCRTDLWDHPAAVANQANSTSESPCRDGGIFKDGFRSLACGKGKSLPMMPFNRFVGYLPKMMAEAEAASGLPAVNHEAEIARISEIIQTCGGLALKARQVYFPHHQVVNLPNDFTEALRKLGPEYLVCSSGKFDISRQVRSVSPDERAIMLWLSGGSTPQIWQGWQHFRVRVFFQPLPDDQFHLPGVPEDSLRGMFDSQNVKGSYIIVEAELEGAFP